MMRNECNIVRDLLPLYAEGLASADSTAYVEEHLAGCNGCRRMLEQMREKPPLPGGEEAVPLIRLRNRMAMQRIRGIALTAVLVLALAVSAFAALDAPNYLPYEENLLCIEKNADGSLSISFAEKVTGYTAHTYSCDPESGVQVCCIEAWTSPWDAFWGAEPQTLDVYFSADCRLPTIYYIQNNGEEDMLVYGSDPLESGGRITLPWLALGYYLIIALVVFAVLALIWMVFRRRKAARKWIERAALLPVAYGIGHLSVKGLNTVSYSIRRDLALIVFSAMLIYCGLLIAHDYFSFRADCRELNAR